MELTQAIDILKTDLAKKQKEIEIINLAIETLKNTFQPELKVLENAHIEIAEKTNQLISKDQIISEKIAIIDSLKEPIDPEETVVAK